MNEKRSIEKLLQDAKSLEFQIENLKSEENKNSYQESLLEILQKDLYKIMAQIERY